MTMYQTKPVYVEAVQWTGINTNEIQDFVGMDDDFLAEPLFHAYSDEGMLYNANQNSWVKVTEGDWVVKGVKGEFAPVSDDIFQATFVLVVETSV